MTRFFFNFQNSVRTSDFEGMELSNLDEAEIEARKDIKDIVLAHFETIDLEWSKWSIEICDDQGRILLVVPFVTH